jgi:hypothetical protein
MTQTGIAIFISLFTAHLIGDFVFQTNKDVKSKSNPLVFLKHIVIITALSYLFSGIWKEWMIPIVIFITHGLLDWVKVKFFSKKGSDNRELAIFLIDQFLHITIIVLLSVFIQQRVSEVDLYWQSIFAGNINILFIFVSAIILLTKVGGIVIEYLVNPYLTQMLESNGMDEVKNPLRGFFNGGRLIGYLERILIFIFILSGSLTAVGFLVAAKSVFRFGEISNPQNRMEAEYIIIGTLYSFILAVTISYGVVHIINLT